MKKIIGASLLVFSAILTITAFAGKSGSTNNPSTGIKEEKGIQFIENNWDKALAEAKLQHKLVFLDAYTTWCGPCKLLKKKTFPDAAAGEFFNKNFINVAVDMEKGAGPALLEKYGVNAFPTLIITDEAGNLLTYTKGFMEAKQLLAFGQHGLSLKK